MKKVKFIGIAVFAVALFFCRISAMGAEGVKYVFLFIGDGFALPQNYMAQEYLKLNGKEGLVFNAFPHAAPTSTYSASSFITDSAASGTAIACGQKTVNGTLGITPSGERLESIAVTAKQNGKKIGIITSVTLNHATPAAFFAHDPSRGNYYAIGLELVGSGFDFFGGGGIGDCDDKKNGAFKGNLYELAKDAGYTVLREAKSLDSLNAQSGKVIACASKNYLPPALDDKKGLRTADFTRKAVELLENGDKGFFIMVEGGQIDFRCHGNDAGGALAEVLEFDDAVRVAVEFMKKHPADTLIVVTADHETGGLTLNCDSSVGKAFVSYEDIMKDLGAKGKGYTSSIGALKYQTASAAKFKEDLSKLAKEKGKAFKFEDAAALLSETFGFGFKEDDKAHPLQLSADESEALSKFFDAQYAKGEKDVLYAATLDLFTTKAGLRFGTKSHTALPVMTFATGKNSEAFEGFLDNTDIAKKLRPMLK